MELKNIQLNDIIKTLRRAVFDKKHPFHFPVLGTINKDFPALRNVVLRDFQELPPTLFFHTDYRSPKITEIQENNNVSFWFYNPKHRLQLRVKAKASIHSKNKIAKLFWHKCSANSIKNYAGKLPPSIKTAEYINNLPEQFSGNVEKLSDIPEAFENFALVSCEVLSIDALLLGRTKHIRKFFTFENGEWTEEYLVA